MNFFFLAFIWLGLTLTLFVLTIIQLVKTIKERKTLTKLRVAKLLTFSLIFLLTFYRHKSNLLIEKIDWIILENKRNEIVGQVKNNELNPNVSWNSWVCKLPFDFPIVSNGGNEILILRNEENDGITIKFWVFRNYFDSPSTYFVYSDDPIEMKILDEKVNETPEFNWKINENWYREYGDF